MLNLTDYFFTLCKQPKLLKCMLVSQSSNCHRKTWAKGISGQQKPL